MGFAGIFLGSSKGRLRARFIEREFKEKTKGVETKKSFQKTGSFIPEKRLELAENRRTVKNQAARVDLGSSKGRLRARFIEREFKEKIKGVEIRRVKAR